MTTIPSNLARLLAGGCALALILPACGGSDDTSGAGDPTTTAAADGGDSDGATAVRWLSPLDQFLGYGVEPTAEQQAEWDQQQRRTEQLIAECMHAQGFEYTPFEPSSTSATSGPWDLPAADFAQQYGYGITTIEPDAFPSSDPNAAAVEAMSVPEKQAYYEALYGGSITVDETGDVVKRGPITDSPAGPDTKSCSAQANAEVYGDGGQVAATSSDDDPFAALHEELSALYDRVENDPRVADARRAWSDCMAEAGHPGFADVYDASAEVNDRAIALMGEDMDQAAADPAALAELRAYEIEVATADLACRTDYDAVHQDVQTEVEQSFIDEHRAELEQYRDAIATGTVGVG
jgi:hypothetical protein